MGKNIPSDENHIIITEEFLQSGFSDRGALTYPQLNILGIPTPPKTGWKKKIIGTEITKATAEEFLKLKNLYRKHGRAELKAFLETSVDENKITAQEKQEVLHLRAGNKTVKSIKELAWNNVDEGKPYNKQLVAFVTEIGLPRCGYYDANTGYFIIKDKDGKEYPFRNVQFWYPLPLLKKAVIKKKK